LGELAILDSLTNLYAKRLLDAGIAFCDKDGESFNNALKRADKKPYELKQKESNRVSI
jgi:PleD family two-component response regulator